jgi:hypothetical protein
MNAKLVLFILVAGTLIACKKDDKGGNSIPAANSEYVIFAWNNLGMHCLNPTYDELVILPPYNTIQVQVIKRGNPPQIISSGIFVNYSLENNAFSYGKRQYGGFWTNYTALFGGTAPAHDIGMTGMPLAGTMTEGSGFYIAEGIPVVPVYDDGTWDPYQVVDIEVKDGNGNVLATTKATVPTSDEINCAKCHAEGSSSAFSNILETHDEENGTSLSSQKPVLCVKCHGSPALGSTGPGTSGKYLSQAIHGFHAGKGANCYDCHPGATTRCSRSNAHMGTGTDGNCTTCHGDMSHVASTVSTGRVPWESEPKCVTCHDATSGVETGDLLYRNSKGHGNVYCAACHGSPHAMYPSSLTKDNYQPKQYMGDKIKSMGSCGVCHESSRGEGSGGEFAEVHAGSKPEVKNTCYVCHTAISTNTTMWPHGYSWPNSNK